LPLHPTNEGFIVRLDHLPELKKAYLYALIKLNKYYADFAHKNGKKNFREFTYDQKVNLLNNSNFCLVPAADYKTFTPTTFF
jgi:4-alpha-glucanotransferase